MQIVKRMTWNHTRFGGWESWVNWLPLRWRAHHLAKRLLARGASPGWRLRMPSRDGIVWFEIVSAAGRVARIDPPTDAERIAG